MSFFEVSLTLCTYYQTKEQKKLIKCYNKGLINKNAQHRLLKTLYKNKEQKQSNNTKHRPKKHNKHKSPEESKTSGRASAVTDIYTKIKTIYI